MFTGAQTRGKTKQDPDTQKLSKLTYGYFTICSNWILNCLHQNYTIWWLLCMSHLTANADQDWFCPTTASYIPLPCLSTPCYIPKVSLHSTPQPEQTEAPLQTYTKNDSIRWASKPPNGPLGHWKYELGEIQSREGQLTSLHRNRMKWE